MTIIKLDFSNVPSDTALFVTVQPHMQALTDDLGVSLMLAPDDRELMEQEIVGTVAKVVDNYVERGSRIK